MNERIKLLAEQAGPLQEVLSEIHGGTPGRYVKNKALLDFQLEKFAELIVRECADIALNHPAKLPSNDWKGVDVPLDTSNRIKQHFGVEE